MTETVEKKPVNARVLAKMEHLHRLINHARTSEAERAAAERALGRLTEAYSAPGDIADKGPGKYVYLWNPGAWEGEKYGEARNLTLTATAVCLSMLWGSLWVCVVASHRTDHTGTRGEV